MITVVIGKEIEKIKGEFESVINGMNMVGEIPYNVYSELFDVGTECIQKAYELGKSELEKETKWHFVKDGDLPKENIYLVIRLNDENTCYKCCTGFWEKEERCFHTLFCDKVDTKDIIAWKEIVLPELKESER